MTNSCSNSCENPEQEIEESLYENEFINMKKTFTEIKELDGQPSNIITRFSGVETAITTDGSTKSVPTPWKEITSSPLVQDSSNPADLMKFKFDVKEFDPSEVLDRIFESVDVHITGNILTVKATTTNKRDSTKFIHEYLRQYHLSPCKVYKVKKFSFDNGILTVLVSCNSKEQSMLDAEESDFEDCLCREGQIESSAESHDS